MGLSHPFYVALKGALAALLALSVVQALGVRDVLSATFVSVACVTPTVYSGLRRGLEQIAASALGGSVTYGLSLVLPRPAALGLGLFFTIAVCFRLGFGRVFLVAAFTVLYVLLLPGETVATLKARIASVAIGVGSAIAVNLFVSAFRFRSVFTRRLTIAAERVAAEYAALAALLTRGAEAGNERARAELFEAIFPMLRTLFEELSDAERDSRLRIGSSREVIAHAQAAAHHLLAVAHYGKDLALGLSFAPGPFPLGADATRTLSLAISTNSQFAEINRVEDDVRRSLISAGRAWERCRSALQGFSRSTK